MRCKSNEWMNEWTNAITHTMCSAYAGVCDAYSYLVSCNSIHEIECALAPLCDCLLFLMECKQLFDINFQIRFHLKLQNQRFSSRISRVHVAVFYARFFAQCLREICLSKVWQRWLCCMLTARLICCGVLHTRTRACFAFVLMFFFLHFIHLSCAVLCKPSTFFGMCALFFALFFSSFLHIWESPVHVIDCINTHTHTFTHDSKFFVLCLCAKRIAESVDVWVCVWFTNNLTTTT